MLSSLSWTVSLQRCWCRQCNSDDVAGW